MKKIGFILLAFTAIVSSVSHSMAQSSTQKGTWDAAFSTGFFFANKYTAGFYDGTGTNNINRIVGNQYLREDIIREIDHTYDTTDIELPGNMKYKPAMSVGFTGAYYLADGFAIIFQGTYVKLKTVNSFLLHYNDIQFPTNTIESYLICPIYASEERTMLDIGIRRSYPINEITEWFFETGFNFTNTIVQDHKIEIGDLTYSIKSNYKNTPYVPNTNYQDYDIQQGGIGWGTMVGLGTNFNFSEQLSLQVAVTGYWNTTKIPGYEGFKFHVNPIVRLVFKNL